MKKELVCMLIDDDSDDQDIFRLAMEGTGRPYKCILANDGVEALEMLAADNSLIPDYIFIDLNMPRMGGRQCLSELRQIERLNKTPLIIFSTSSEQRDITETMQMGASDYISKPSSISTLSRLLSHVFASEKSTGYSQRQV
jgi:CheY-like chemotaxis protein